MAGTSPYFFVYGTLLDPKANAFAARLWQQGRKLGEGWFQGRLYKVAHYPGAVPSDDPADRVRGLLIELSDPARTLPDLDAYEDAPALYRREVRPVTRADGAAVNAWIYLYNRPVRALPRIRSEDFRRLVS